MARKKLKQTKAARAARARYRRKKKAVAKTVAPRRRRKRRRARGGDLGETLLGMGQNLVDYGAAVFSIF